VNIVETASPERERQAHVLARGAGPLFWETTSPPTVRSAKGIPMHSLAVETCREEDDLRKTQLH
jgi:hypothetical protein